MKTQDKAVLVVKEIPPGPKAEDERPFSVSIMGQTGVGKSSLLNALFKVQLKTDPVKPCTKEITRVEIKGSGNQKLWFYDLPGIGESAEADEKHLNQYLEKIQESDVVLWAIHADSHATTFELEALQKLFDRLDEVSRISFFSKLTIVLTKADLLAQPAWIFWKVSGKKGFIEPSKQVEEILAAKKDFCKETLFRPFARYFASETHNDSGIAFTEPQFTSSQRYIIYSGEISAAYFDQLRQKYPQATEALNRLEMSQEVVPVSSQFKYNLDRLMRVIINKLGEEAIGRYEAFLGVDKLASLPITAVKQMGNLIVYDVQRDELNFSFSQTNF
ncbi:MAG: GTPase [Bacteroidota bacterium]